MKLEKYFNILCRKVNGDYASLLFFLLKSLPYFINLGISMSKKEHITYKPEA